MESSTEAARSSSAPWSVPRPSARLALRLNTSLQNLKGKDFVVEYGKDLRLSNFTATESESPREWVRGPAADALSSVRNSKLRGADVRGAYFIKAVAPDSCAPGFWRTLLAP